jgi:hypothetical protein
MNEIVTAWQKHEGTARIKWEQRIFSLMMYNGEIKLSSFWATLTKAKTLWKNPIDHLEYWKLRDQWPSMHSLCLVTATGLKRRNGEHGTDVTAKRKRCGATKFGQEVMGSWTRQKTVEMVRWRDLECAIDYGSYKSIFNGAQYVTPVKFIGKKSKCAFLGHEIGFSFVQLAVPGKRRNTVVHLPKRV